MAHEMTGSEENRAVQSAQGGENIGIGGGLIVFQVVLLLLFGYALALLRTWLSLGYMPEGMAALMLVVLIAGGTCIGLFYARKILFRAVYVPIVAAFFLVGVIAGAGEDWGPVTWVLLAIVFLILAVPAVSVYTNKRVKATFDKMGSSEKRMAAEMRYDPPVKLIGAWALPIWVFVLWPALLVYELVSWLRTTDTGWIYSVVIGIAVIAAGYVVVRYGRRGAQWIIAVLLGVCIAALIVMIVLERGYTALQVIDAVAAAANAAMLCVLLFSRRMRDYFGTKKERENGA